MEYKAGWNPQAVLHSICAFANDFHNLGGGYVVLGVEERDGQPSLPPRGVDPGRIESLQNELLRLGDTAVQPHYHPLTAVYDIDGRTMLVLWAPGGETRPYKARVSLASGGTEWAYDIRRHSSTVRARGDDERELLSLAATVPCDDRYHQAASLDDLSPRLIEQFLRDVGSDLAMETGLSTETLGSAHEYRRRGRRRRAFPRMWGSCSSTGHRTASFLQPRSMSCGFLMMPVATALRRRSFRGPLSIILREAIRLHRPELPQGNRDQASTSAGSRAILELPPRGRSMKHW